MISNSQHRCTDLLLTPWGRRILSLACAAAPEPCLHAGNTALMVLVLLQHPSSLPVGQPSISAPCQPGEALG